MSKKIIILLLISFLYSCELQVEKVDKDIDSPFVEEKSDIFHKKISIISVAKEVEIKLNKDIKNIKEILDEWDIEKSLWLIKELYSENNNNLEIISLYVDIYINKWVDWDFESWKEAIKIIENFIDNNKSIEKKELTWLYSKLWYFYEIDSNFELAEKKYKLSIMIDKYYYEWYERLLGLYMNNKKYEDFNKNFEIALKRVRENKNISSAEKWYLFEKFNKIALEVIPKQNDKKWIIWK